MKLFTTALFISFLSFAAFAVPESHQVTRPDGSKIDFYLTKPDTAKFSVVLVVQGSGCHTSYSAKAQPFTLGNGERAAATRC